MLRIDNMENATQD